MIENTPISKLLSDGLLSGQPAQAKSLASQLDALLESCKKPNLSDSLTDILRDAKEANCVDRLTVPKALSLADRLRGSDFH